MNDLKVRVELAVSSIQNYLRS